MLAPLLADQPVLVNGQPLPADDPRALLQPEMLVSNWLVRSAELIGAELPMPVVAGLSCVAICSGIGCWPRVSSIVSATSSTASCVGPIGWSDRFALRKSPHAVPDAWGGSSRGC